MKKIIILVIVVAGLVFISDAKNKQPIKISESNDSTIDLMQSRFAGKVFEAGLDKHFNIKEKCAFHFQCDCCKDILMFVDETTYYILSNCMSNTDLTRGSYSVNDSLVKIVSDDMLISKKYNWELEVNPNAEPKSFINDTIHKKYEFEFKIKYCDGEMLISETKNGESYIAVETTIKMKDEFKKLKGYGFDKYINLN